MLEKNKILNAPTTLEIEVGNIYERGREILNASRLLDYLQKILPEVGKSFSCHSPKNYHHRQEKDLREIKEQQTL